SVARVRADGDAVLHPPIRGPSLLRRVEGDAPFVARRAGHPQGEAALPRPRRRRARPLRGRGDRHPVRVPVRVERVRRAPLPHLMSTYDETQAIGRRYRRQDEIGTPLCVTVDFESLEDQAVTIRERDSMAQIRVAIADLVPALREKLGA